MGETVTPTGLAPVGGRPSEIFLRSVATELTSLHGELMSLMHDVPLREEDGGEGGPPAITLAPTLAQRHDALALLQRYRHWSDRVRPFLDRSPMAPIADFEGAFQVLASYFALRRIGTGITHELWRELFELESAGIVRFQLELLDRARECFALLDPRPRTPMETLSIRFAPLDGQRYRVFAESVRGDVAGEMMVPFDAKSVENFILRYCDPLRGAVRGWTPASVQPYAEFGGKLFDALFAGPVRDLYMAHASAVAAGEAGLRMRFRVGETPALAGLPWEYLYDGTDFVALTGAVALTRHVDAHRMIRPLRVDGPLRIAVTVSSPTDRAPLDAAKEVDNLRAALAPLAAAGLVRIDVAPNGTLATLAAMLRSADAAGRPFHVWHFIGHGRHLEREGATFLTFESPNGNADLHSGFALGTLLAAHPALRLAVLNACEGGRGAPEDSLTSVGAALVARGLPAAVAMQFSITDLAALQFADDFYRALADGALIEAAVADARRSIFFMPNASEWATPVIMSRGGDGLLFDVRRAEHGV